MSATGSALRSNRLALAWVLLAAVLVSALVIGARRPGPAPTAAQRAAAIEADVRCPSCEDISVAQSSAPTAQAIRTAVVARVTAGQSDEAIESYLVSRYGRGILLRPPVSGGAGLVWLLPVLGVAVALGGLALFFWRRRAMVVPDASEEDRAMVHRALAGQERP